MIHGQDDVEDVQMQMMTARSLLVQRRNEVLR